MGDGGPGRCDRRAFLAATAAAAASPVAGVADPAAENLPVPAWLRQVTRMTFTGDVAAAAAAGAQVVHTNLVWPYFPLRRDGGGLPKADADRFRELMTAARQRGGRVCLGLPPFPPVALVEEHPDWRVHPDRSGSVLKLKPTENLGTRVGCNLGPWGDYLTEVCAELVEDFGVDGFSFDGNYHPPVCHCPACAAAYKKDSGRELPEKANLDDVAYREYLVWRGERLEDHYRRLNRRIKAANKDAVVFTWTVNAGRYGHFLHSPRAMPTRLNLAFDGAMQEWWFDETNQGGSLAPAFGAAYLRAVLGGKPAACEPYLMSRGNPYGTDSFPAHERLTRTLLGVTSGCGAAESLGWAGHGAASAAASLKAVGERAPWLTGCEPLPWAALLVSEQTRQFYAYKDIADRFLPHVIGAFRALTEEHLPVTPVNDWDLTPEALAKYAVLILPNAAALSAAQCDAVRAFVKAGGGLVATGETSLCDELGRPRGDFALADVFGVRYEGRPKAPLSRRELDPNFAVAIDADYWKQRTGVATLTWDMDRFITFERLRKLVPTRSVNFRGPLVQVALDVGALRAAVPVWMRPEGHVGEPLPAVVRNRFGNGQVVYLAAALDAALWSYAYPYQRVLFTRALEAAAGAVQPPVTVRAPLCVQATYFTQETDAGRRTVVHLFNGVNTAADHGLPATEVPLREETIPIHGIRVTFSVPPKRITCQPGDQPTEVSPAGPGRTAHVPPLELHSMVVAEW